MKYNFLIITSSYPAISGESFEGACIEVFAQALARQGHHVIILTQCVRKNYYKDSDDLVVRRFQWGKHVKPLSTFRIKSDFGKIFLYFSNGLNAASKIVRENKVDFTLCAWALPSGLFGLFLKKRYGIPYVIWALGSDIWSYSTFSISRGILRSIFNNALHIYADGLSLAEEISQITSKKATFLPTSRILPEVISSNLTLDPGRIHFLFVGRYHINKGPDNLISAIHLLPSILQEKSYFHFFGVGDMKECLESMIAKYRLNDCISLNGPINIYDLSKYLKAVDYIVIPSRIESIPVILSDALQKKCPIIATNVGDMGRLLTQHGIGYISQDAEPNSLSETLSKAILNKNVAKDRMQDLYNLFDPDINARKFLQALTRVRAA
jgi:glycosyltransferase involved in cell wall biosynthesis